MLQTIGGEHGTTDPGGENSVLQTQRGENSVLQNPVPQTQSVGESGAAEVGAAETGTQYGRRRQLQEGPSRGKQSVSGRTVRPGPRRHTGRKGRKPEKETKVSEPGSER